MAKKKQAFFDIDRGIMGTYAGFINGTEKGFIKPMYYALGDISIKKRTYTQEIRKDSMHPLTFAPEFAGVQQEIVIIANSTEGGGIDAINKIQAKKIQDLRDQLNRAGIEIGAKDYELATAKAGKEHDLARESKQQRMQKRDNPFSNLNEYDD